MMLWAMLIVAGIDSPATKRPNSSTTYVLLLWAHQSILVVRRVMSVLDTVLPEVARDRESRALDKKKQCYLCIELIFMRDGDA